MANISEDIQYAGFDTYPSMLDRTDFASWKQCIRLYCQGKENGVNILKSIDEGPFQMRTVREPLAEGMEGAPHLGPERPRENVKMLLEGSELTKEDQELQLDDDFEHFLQHKGETIHDYYVRFAKLINDMRNIKMTMSKMQLNSKFVNNMLPEWDRFVTGVKLNRGLRDSNYDLLYAYLKQHEIHANENKMMLDRFTQHTVDPLALMSNVSHQQQYSHSSSTSPSTYNRGQGTNPQGRGVAGYGGVQNRVRMLIQVKQDRVALDEEQLLFLAGGQDTAIDEDVDEKPVQDLALNVDNVFQVDEYPVNDEAKPSYDSNILSEVYDHDHYQATVCEHHEEHAMHDNVQLNHVVDSHADDTGDSNMIPYDQYVKDNAVPVVHSNVSSVPNDAYMMIYNDMYEPHAKSVSKTSRNTIVKNSLTAELATYKEQVELYERRARFKLTEREQKINEQLRLVISDRNFKEETLKKELHYVKLQVASTINHNKLIVEEVTSLKKNFKQKENKYLEDFLDMKSLKEKVAIGYKNPLYLTCVKQVQPALYNGHEIIKDNHVSAIVHNTEDTLEIAEITRRKINDKIKDPECVTHKVKIAPHDYSKENFLATFTPQKQLTPDQIFWSQYLIKIKYEALKEQTTVSRPIKTLMVYPPNTPATLVPRVLSTKNVFEELEAEVAQNIVDRKHDEIERKNLLIANDNLIAECLSKEVFSVATNFELNVARFTKMHVANTIVKTCCLELEAELSNLRDKSHNDNHDEALDSQITQLTAKVTALQAQNDLFRAENDQIKQHYKELYDSIKITRAKHIEQMTALTTENVNLKAQILNTVNSVSKDHVKPKVLAPGEYAIDVEPIFPRLRNNREARLDYLRHLKESVETIRDIVEEAKVVRPLDSLIISACCYIKHSQELFEYAISTCPQDYHQRDKKLAPAPLIRKKQVTFA
nr:hypothetical protein [Tanacetum cinerariifolium]